MREFRYQQISSMNTYSIAGENFGRRSWRDRIQIKDVRGYDLNMTITVKNSPEDTFSCCVRLGKGPSSCNK